MQTSCVRHDHRERHRYRSRHVLVSMGVIIAFLLAAFAIGCFIGRLRQRFREQSGEE